MPTDRNINETEGLYYRVTSTNTINYKTYGRTYKKQKQKRSSEEMERKMKYALEKEKLDI